MKVNRHRGGFLTLFQHFCADQDTAASASRSRLSSSVIDELPKPQPRPQSPTHDEQTTPIETTTSREVIDELSRGPCM